MTICGCRNFERGGSGRRQCIGLDVVYRKCKQQTICLLYGKLWLIGKNSRLIWGWPPPFLLKSATDYDDIRRFPPSP